jgi:hypothetical protein
MPQIESPFNEPERKESPGEAAQRLASLGQDLLRIIGVNLWPYEVDGLAVVINAIIRKHKWVGELWK